MVHRTAGIGQQAASRLLTSSLCESYCRSFDTLVSCIATGLAILASVSQSTLARGVNPAQGGRCLCSTWPILVSRPTGSRSCQSGPPSRPEASFSQSCDTTNIRRSTNCGRCGGNSSPRCCAGGPQIRWGSWQCNGWQREGNRRFCGRGIFHRKRQQAGRSSETTCASHPQKRLQCRHHACTSSWHGSSGLRNDPGCFH